MLICVQRRKQKLRWFTLFFAMERVTDALAKQSPLCKLTVSEVIAPQMGESSASITKLFHNKYLDAPSIKTAAEMDDVSLPPPDSGGSQAERFTVHMRRTHQCQLFHNS